MSPKTVIKDNGQLPAYFWCDPSSIRKECIHQIDNLTELPFLVDHIAVMPNVHEDLGSPKGVTLATNNVIIPNAVGSDIGGGLLSVEFDLMLHEIMPKMSRILDDIYEVIPLGTRWHDKPQSWIGFDLAPEIYPISSELYSSKRQLGTLGTGSHFIEIQRDTIDESLWITIHAGSNYLGKVINNHFGSLATQLNQLGIDPSKQLCGFTLDSKEGQSYYESMNYCINFAQANRKRILKSILEIIDKYVPNIQDRVGALIETHHNYASIEQYDIGSENKEVIIHRKGTIKSSKGSSVIIPGSMGTMTYIGVGLGNDDSFNSCSNGSGRKYSRAESMRFYDERSVSNHLGSRGSLLLTSNPNIAEESPSAYNDVAEVINHQRELVDISVELKPIGIIKG